MTWFQSIIREQIDRRGARGGLAALAREWGIDHTVLIKWRDGSEPGLKNVELVLAKTGGDMRRALPDWESEKGETIEVLGQVAAGQTMVAYEERRTMDASTGPWRHSAFWKHTTGPVVFLEIHGQSMEPDFRDGSFIACRRPADARKIPSLAPCVFRVGEEVTVKCFQAGTPGFVAGVPLNRSQEVMFFREWEVSIDYLVLGVLDPWRKGARVQPRAMLMEDSKPTKASKPVKGKID